MKKCKWYNWKELSETYFLRGNIFLKIVRFILTIVVIALGGYTLVTQTLELMPYYMFFMGALLLVTGLSELQKDRNGFWGYTNIAISIFAFLASIQAFLLN